MPKKEFICFDCDGHFTITSPKGYEVLYCPFCGGELCQDDCNDYEDED